MAYSQKKKISRAAASGHLLMSLGGLLLMYLFFGFNSFSEKFFGITFVAVAFVMLSKVIRPDK